MVKKKLNDEDRSLWNKVAQTVQPIISSISGRSIGGGQFFEQSADLTPPTAKKPIASMPQSKTKSSPKVRLLPRPAMVSPANLDISGFGGISRSSARSIKSGQAGYTRKIDLHGCGRDEAFIRLKSFIISSIDQDHRNILIITGKGVRGNGVIKAHLQTWLNEAPLSAHIIAYCQAKPKDGGGGAWYVNLRRKK